MFEGPYRVQELLRVKRRERFLLRRYILGVNVAREQTMGEIAFWIWTLFLVDVDHDLCCDVEKFAWDRTSGCWS